MSELTPNLGLFKYDPSTDGKEVFSINAALNDNWDILDNLGSGKNIGEIVTSTIPLTDAGLHLLDGALIQGDGIYSAFVTYIAGLVSTYPDLFTTESAWQSTVTQYGVCGKFVYDSINNTVRLPKITGILEGTTDTSALLDLIEAGLPNPNLDIVYRQDSTSSGVYTDIYGTNGYTSGSYSNTDGTDEYMQTSLGKGVYAPFGAVPTNDIYGNSNTVQPQTIKVLYYIVIATSTKTNIQVDIDEIATDLNGKVNISELAEVQCVVETYQNGTSWYRVYNDGWCEQGGRVTYSSGYNGNQTVNFLKTFINTNYSILTSKRCDTGYDGTVYAVKVRTYTTSSMVLSVNIDNSGAVDWQACGYIS